jgi:hypothetical protein
VETCGGEGGCAAGGISGIGGGLVARVVVTQGNLWEGECDTRFSEENQVHTYMHAKIKFHAYSDI